MSNPFQEFDWVFTNDEVKNSPSRRDGVPEKEEQEGRHIICGYIQEVGMKLKMPQYTIATAVVFFHRFYMRHSMKAFDKHLVGMACLFLSGKAEETPRKLKDTVAMGYQIKYPGKPALKPDSEDMSKRMDALIMFEREVLKAILFNMKVDHPYQELIRTVKQMKGQRDLAQVAWNLVNDSLRTTCCLRYKPKMIAIAAIYLASKMINQSIQLETVPNLKVQELEEIGNDILDLYDNNTCEKPAGATSLPPKATLGKPAAAPPKPPPKPPAPKPPPPPAGGAAKKEGGSEGGTKRSHDQVADSEERETKVAKTEEQPK